MRNRVVNIENSHEVYDTDDARLWLHAAAERGWTAPTWPKEFGGGGLTYEEGQIFQQEMANLKALTLCRYGSGYDWAHPSEYGTEEQKHVPTENY